MAHSEFSPDLIHYAATRRTFIVSAYVRAARRRIDDNVADSMRSSVAVCIDVTTQKCTIHTGVRVSVAQ